MTLNRLNHPWLFDIYPAAIRSGAEKPADLPEEVATAWDLTLAGLSCRLGRMVLKEYDPEETDLRTDPTAVHFLADRAVQEALKNWKSPIYLGPAAMPCSDGSLTVTLDHGSSTGRTFVGIGLWVPQGDFAKEGVWIPDADIRVDPSVITSQQLK